MKKVLLSFLFIPAAFTTQAQDAKHAKPSKEQTTEYIVNTLKNHSANFFNSDDDPKPYTLENADIFFDNYLLTIRISEVWDNQNLKRNYKYILNLKDIEKISLDKKDNNYELSFYCYNSKKLINVEMIKTSNGITKPGINNYVATFVIPTPNDEKLIQAFNHLRKLCGAPDPIEF